ncbi:carbon-nitrogen ligase with glutamine as amido-N-donor [Saitozyma sp. JCM 24511]|nr:carbon-nitrogen ligase with glutamine as amido-N-donor [Saitozyma sp. JCM 24511]
MLALGSSWSALGRHVIAGPSSLIRCSRCVRAASSRAAGEGWETVIGLEIHAQLRTGRKLFSRALTSHNDPVNTHVEPLDAAFPGSLPVLDPEAIRLSLLTALALDCKVNPRSTFDRKHYFYHDIPSSYQITQHYNPLANSGRVRIQQGENGSTRSFDVGIIQLQVEQDTAKSQTIGSEVLVDLNRAGTGLMEIVTRPDMRSPEEAGAFVRKLQGLLRRVGSGDGDMEKGNLRVDANVSVHRPGTAFGTRCEIKNLNSVRFLQTAIEAERRRHIAHYETNSEPLRQETRQLDESTGETYALRSKEEAEDYRYMPDANLPAMIIDPGYLDTLRSQIPEMPWDTVQRLTAEFGVVKRDVETLVALDEYEAKGVAYFEQVVQGDKQIGKKASNWIAHELLGQLGKVGREWDPRVVPSGLMRELVQSVENGTITGTTGKAIIRHAVSLSPDDAGAIDGPLSQVLETLGLTPVSSDDLRATCEAAIAALPKEADAVRKGNQKVAMRLVGEVMKRSQGRADAKKAREIILEILADA